MSTLTPDLFSDCVTDSSLAPSVHNVQPARWARRGPETITLSCDATVALDIADPSGRDLLLSCGTALEGMVMALRKRGFAADVQISEAADLSAPVACLHLHPEATEPEPLYPFIHTRFTCRGGFAPVPPDMLQALKAWAKDQHDVHLITQPETIASLAAENDRLSLELFRNTAFRQELRHWMRLSPRHRRWAFDGLNASAMALSRAEALAIPTVLSRPGFWLLDRLGLSKSLTSEAAKAENTCAILCLSAPAAQSPVLSGRRYYRICLELARLGLSSWPASVLVDDAAYQVALSSRFGLCPDQRLISCLRLGLNAPPPPLRARRLNHEVIAT